MLIHDITPSCAAPLYNQLVSSLGEIHATDSAHMAGELAGVVLASYASHNLRNSPQSIVHGRHRRARLSAMANAARLKLDMIEVYR